MTLHAHGNSRWISPASPCFRFCWKCAACRFAVTRHGHNPMRHHTTPDDRLAATIFRWPAEKCCWAAENGRRDFLVLAVGNGCTKIHCNFCVCYIECTAMSVTAQLVWSTGPLWHPLGEGPATAPFWADLVDTRPPVEVPRETRGVGGFETHHIRFEMIPTLRTFLWRDLRLVRPLMIAAGALSFKTPGGFVYGDPASRPPVCTSDPNGSSTQGLRRSSPTARPQGLFLRNPVQTMRPGFLFCAGLFLFGSPTLPQELRPGQPHFFWSKMDLNVANFRFCDGTCICDSVHFGAPCVKYVLGGAGRTKL